MPALPRIAQPVEFYSINYDGVDDHVCAFVDSGDGDGDPVGYGVTPYDALLSLLEQVKP